MTVSEIEHESVHKPSRRNDVDVHELDGEALLYDRRSGAVHYFNSTSLMVWNLCDGSRKVTEIADALATKCAVSVEQARIHVRRAVEDFSSRDLLLDPKTTDPTSKRPRAKEVDSTADSPISDPRFEPIDDAPTSGGSAVNRSEEKHPSRREVLSGTAAKLVYTAPLISTFFATGAYASGPSASAAFGAGGCKTIGYSCGTVSDCCVDASDGKCQSSTCCLKKGESTCDHDADCCDGNTCTGGTCDGNPCGDPGDLCFINSDCCSAVCDLGQCD